MWQWTEARERAAQLLAADELTDEQIAAEIGVVRTTIWNWKQTPEFMARVEAHTEEYREAIRKHGIAIVENRVKQLDRHWKALQKVIEERANDPELQKVPGGSTGLVIRRVRSVGSGDTFERFEEYEVDVATLAELRALQQQAAQQLGQWGDRLDVTTNGEGWWKAYDGVDPSKDLGQVAVANRMKHLNGNGDTSST